MTHDATVLILTHAVIKHKSNIDGDAGAYPTDVSDEERSFVVPSLTLKDSKAPQWKYELRELFSAVRWLVRPGADS